MQFSIILTTFRGRLWWQHAGGRGAAVETAGVVALA